MKKVTLFLGLAMIAQPLTAQDWHQWRGPDRDGLANYWQLPDSLSEPQKLWEISVGEGHSSPVLWGEQLFLLSRSDGHELVSSYSREKGSLDWQQRYPAPFTVNSYATDHGKGPKATPVLAEGKLITFGIKGMISVFNAATGKIIWQKQHYPTKGLPKEFICPPCDKPCDKKSFTLPGKCPQQGCTKSLLPKEDTAAFFYGMSSSPIVLGKHLIVHPGNAKRGAVAAYSLASGDLVWERKGPGPGSSSPMLMTFDGVEQLVVFTRNSLIGLNPSSGKTLWERSFPDKYNENIVTPLFFKGMIIVSGPRTPLQAVEIIRDQQGAWKAIEKWHNSKVNLFMSSPVLSDGRLFGFNDKKKGQFIAVNPDTGKLLWASKGRMGKNASLIVTSEKIVTMSTDGSMRVFKNSNTEVLLASYALSKSPVWAHLVPGKGRSFFLRSKNLLSHWSF